MWTIIHDPRVAGMVGLAATAAATAYSATLNHSSAEAAPPPKTRVVVLGSGWSSMTFMKELSPKDKEKYDITVVSPRNYFLYTPLLPAVASGTCEERSIVESVRNIVHGKGQYYEAQCEQVDIDRKAIWACKKNADGSSGTCFEMKYDLLVMGVGAGTSSFGIRGVDQNCLYFKSIEDANALRRRVSECFEEAALPDTSEELRKQLLTFVVCGGGPTGVEVAAELHDMIKDDLAKMYPSLLPHVKISLVEMMPRVLGMYSSKVSEYTQTQFEKAGIELRLNTRVTEVQPGKVQVVDKEGNASAMAFGACVWATGIGMNPLVRQVKDALPQHQTNPRAIVTDPYFRVEGSQNSIWAMGDAASIAPPATSQCVEHILAHADQPSSPIVSLQQLPELLLKASKEHPHLAAHAEYLTVMLRGSWTLESVLGKAGVHANAAVHKQVLGDIENKDSLTREELASLLGRMDAQSRPLPPTAQRARQQGAYLARLFQQHQMDASGEVPAATKPFQYTHQGSAAYVGQDKAVLDTVGWGTLVGSHAGVVWKGFETMSQISFKNQVLVGIDWFRSKIFGRDISKV